MKGNQFPYDVKELREKLDQQPWERVEADREERAIFLGSVFNVYPSGKYYQPFACGNLHPCPRCKGLGKRLDAVKTPIQGRHGLYCMARWVPCGRCDGGGSHEAADDERFAKVAEKALAKIGAYLTGGEGDGCDVYVMESRDISDAEEEGEDR